MLGEDDVHAVTAIKMEALQAELKETKKALLAARAETAMERERADEYRILFERTPLPYQSLNGAGHFMDVNPAWLEMTGYSHEEVVGAYFGDFLTTEHKDLFSQRFARFKEIGEVHDVQFDLVAKDGRIIPVSFEGRIGRRSDGSFRQTHCIMRSLAEQRAAESAAAKSEERYRALAENSGDVILRFDRDFRHLYANPAAERVTGIPRATFIGKTHREIGFKPEECEFWETQIERVFATGGEERIQFEYEGVEGKVIFDWHLVPEFGPDGSVQTVLSTSRDITVIKRAEDAMRIANQRLQQAATLAPLPMGMFTEDGDIVFLNRAWLELSGYSAEEMHSVSDWRERVYGDRAAAIGAEIDSIFDIEGRFHQGEREIVTASGEKRVWDFSISQLGRLVDGRRTAISMAMDVTERKASQDKIAQLSRLYRFLSEVNQAIVRTHSEQELFEQVCRVAVEHGGFPLAWIGLVDEESGQVVPQAIHGTGEDTVRHLNISSRESARGTGVVARAVRTGRSEFSNDLLNDERSYPWREANMALGFNSCAAFPIKLGGRVLGALCVDSTQEGFFDDEEIRLLEDLAGDISFAMRTMEIERQRASAETALRESEQRYRTLFENSMDAVLLTAPDGTILAGNQAATRIFGYSDEELRGLGRAALVDMADPRVVAAIEERARSGRVTAELTFRRKGGSPVEVEVTSTVFCDEQGQVRTSMIIRDITDRRRAEEARLRLAAIVESSQDAIIGKTLDGIITSWNPAAERLYGYTSEEMIGSSISLLIPEEMSDELPFVLAQIKAGRSVSRYETVRTRKDGVRIDVSITVSPARDSSGAITGAATIARDISNRKRAEAALRERTELLQTILDNIPVMINFFDEGGRFVWGNRQWETALGWTAADLSNGNTMEKVYPDPNYRRSVLECIERANGGWDDFKNRTRDGRTLDVTWANIRLSNGSNVGIGIDITERKRMEQQLLRAQRLETAGTVAGQVAHDFNNLLGPVMAYPEMILPFLPSGSPALEYCEIIVEAAQHMAEINDDLLALSRRGRLETEAVDLNRLVLQSVEQLNEAAPKLAVDLRLDSGLLPADGSASQILRVFQNLISNARDAMRDTGIITVSTANVYVDAPTGAYNRVEQGEYAKVTVADTGCGIPEAIRGQIFDAFFSTKRGSRRGCGLGLAVVQSIVEDHHGFIDLESIEGVGTKFAVYFPISRTGSEAGEAVESHPRGNEKILVVDDDPLQRKVLSQILRTNGYEVAAVASGEEALAYLREQRADLVLLDMVMPGKMDGAETYRRILDFQPGQRAILISGYADTERVGKTLALGAGAFLRKPVTLQQLTAAVRQELDR